MSDSIQRLPLASRQSDLLSLLNLPLWTITNIYEAENIYEIKAVSSSVPHSCPQCNQRNFSKYGTDAQIFHDTPIHGKWVTIHVDRQRYRCTHCGKTFFQTLPDVDDKRFATERLITYLQRRSMSETFVSLAKEVGLHEKTVRRIFHDYVETLKRSVHFVTPRIIHVDELDVINQARSIITNAEAGTIVECLADRKKQTMMQYLSQLENRERIEMICIDMWQPHREAIITILPQVTIVIDKFYVIKLANEAIEKMRKEVRVGMSDKQRRKLMQGRFLLLKRRNVLEDKERLTLESWTKNFPTLGKAYDLKEQFCEIWDAKNKSEAQKRYSVWQEQITPEVSDAFAPIISTIEKWNNEVFAYFDYRFINKYTESLNKLVQIIQNTQHNSGVLEPEAGRYTVKLSRKYSFEVLRTRLLYTVETLYVQKEIEQHLINFGVSIAALTQWIEQGNL